MLSFDTPLKDWSLVKSKTRLLSAFGNLSITTVKNLLFHFPTRYEDLTRIYSIQEARNLFLVPYNDKVTLQGTLTSIKNWRTPKRKISITEGMLEDRTGTIKVMWFNQPFLIRTLKKGVTLNLSGKISKGKEQIFQNPSYEFMREGKKAVHTGRLTPIYPETKGVTSKWLRFLISKIFPEITSFPDPLPKELRAKLQLPETKTALFWIHFPKNQEEITKAKTRFTFEEMLMLQLLWQKVRQTIKEKKAPLIPLQIEAIKEFLSTLPFPITQSQRKATWDIVRDLAKPEPMNRLLEGDVGSGKTVVAALAALGVLNTGKQVALMTPTEILARQHFETFSKLLGHLQMPLALITGKTALFKEGELQGNISKTALKEMVQAGKIKTVIGTTALIQKELKFNDLGLVVVDEQHRFGIKQRSRLVQAAKVKKPVMPHFLSLTATPIPRTLALTLFGDLDLSLLEEMPKGERIVSTKLLTPETKQEAYELIRQTAKQGNRIFVICPRIEPSAYRESLIASSESVQNAKRRWNDAKAVEVEYKKLSEEVFPDLKVGKLHGKMKPEEKEIILQKFRKGEIEVLVTTSVIEVGVDIPEATVMLVEGAEYFGLAQLHQLRGRIGRAGNQAHFLLSMTTASPETRKRLEALEKINSGFALAEIDLKLRGPGEFLGTRQWGQADLGMIMLIDTRLIHSARKEAQELMAKDKTLSSWPELKKEVERRFEKLHRE